MRLKIVKWQTTWSTLTFLLGVKLDWKLNFDAHISDICKRAHGKLNALVRTVPFIGLSKCLF